MKYEKTVVIFAVAFSIILTSCESDFKNQSEYADEYMERIVQCLDNNDEDGIRQLFSSDTQSSNPDLDKEISELLDFYEGSYKEHKLITSISGGESVRKGKLAEQHIGNAKYELTTDRQTYTLSFAAITVDVESPQLVGLNRIWFGTGDDNYVIVDSERG